MKCTKNKKINITNDWLCGFTDAEGCFNISISRSNNVVLRFIIGQHKTDVDVLRAIQSKLGCGNINISGDDAQLVVSKNSDIYDAVIPFFTKYQLKTLKYLDFTDFCAVANIKCKTTHLTRNDLNEIRRIKKNRVGWSHDIKRVDNRILLRSDFNFNEWLCGFTDGDGHFAIGVWNSKGSKLGKKVALTFAFGQNSRDSMILEHIKEHLNCGHVYYYERVTRYQVRNIEDLTEKVIPFFERFELKTRKRRNFKSFRSVSKMIKAGKHLTQTGLNKIIAIKGMLR